MLPQVVTVGPLAAASANNICQSQSPGSASNLTINGSAATGGVATLDVPRRVLITSAGNDSGRTFTVTGTNATGNPMRESLAGGNAVAVYTSTDFATVTVVAIDGASAGAVTVGTNVIASSPWKIVNYLIGPMNMSFGVVQTGTVNWTIQITYDNPNSNQNQRTGAYNGTFPAVPTSFNHPILTAQAASLDGTINDPILAWRLVVNSGATGTSSVTATGIQAGINNPR